MDADAKHFPGECVAFGVVAWCVAGMIISGFVAGHAASAIASEPQFYLSSLLASSRHFQSLSGPLPAISRGIDAAGGSEAAIGLSLPRPVGSMRIELEARSCESDAAGDGVFGAEWSSMANVWRDVAVCDRLAVYVGGGLGGGGRSAEATSSGAASGMVWQAGFGTNVALNRRMAFDLGYRCRGLEAGAASAVPPDSEVLVTLRVFDPFRRWGE